MLTALNLDGCVAALEAAVKAAPGAAVAGPGAAASARGGIPPAKTAKELPVSGLALPPRASASASTTATSQPRFVAEGAHSPSVGTRPHVLVVTSLEPPLSQTV